MNTLEVRNLVKTFPTKEGYIKAVDNVSFTVRKGEIFGLLGVNGAGKSTMINILSGLTAADSGEVLIFGKTFQQDEEDIKGRFNVATAYYQLHHLLTVKQNLLVYAQLYNVRNPQEKIDQLSARFMIKHLYQTRIKSLSSGEKTRVVLVKSLLNDPELLFLDECTVGLDPDMAEITREHLKEYNKKTGCTILFTSHYMPEVEKLCGRIAFMDQGKIITIGQAKTLVKELDKQTVELHLKGNLERAGRLLKELGIRHEQQQKIIRFTIKNRKNVLYPLLKRLIRNNIVFEDIRLEKPTLEEYFIKKSRK